MAAGDRTFTAGTPVTWLASGGSAVLTCTSLANGVGRQGARYDFGTAARSLLWRWRFHCELGGAPTVGVVLARIYWKSDDGTYADNDDGTGDANVSAEDKLRNLDLLDTIIADEAASSVIMVRSGMITLPHRYGMPVIWNSSGQSFSATAAEHGFLMDPILENIAQS